MGLLGAERVLPLRAELKNVPVLFFANKMDLPTALTPVECVQQVSSRCTPPRTALPPPPRTYSDPRFLMPQLELDKVTDKPWHIACVPTQPLPDHRHCRRRHEPAHAPQATPRASRAPFRAS